MQAFIDESLNILEEQLKRIKLSVERLEDESLWKKVRPEMNSIGNLCIHIAGNEMHHIGCAIGGIPFIRHRSEEFTISEGLSIRDVIQKLDEVRQVTRTICSELTEQDLNKQVVVEFPSSTGIGTFTMSAMNAIYHAIEHYIYHTGQIILLAKIFQPSNDRILQWKH